jgi:hypothetical protein
MVLSAAFSLAPKPNLDAFGTKLALKSDHYYTISAAEIIGVIGWTPCVPNAAHAEAASVSLLSTCHVPTINCNQQEHACC